MKRNILVQTNLLVCVVIIIGFLITAVLAYRANINVSLENIEQVSALTSEGIYHQIENALTKPLNVSLTMANDSLLHSLLTNEADSANDASYMETLQEYLNTYQTKYGYDSVFLVSAASAHYYNFNGLDRVLDPSSPENNWYFGVLLNSNDEYTMNVDNDEVAGADNAITVFINCKIRDNDGTLLGVVGVGVRIDSLQRILQTYQDQFDVNAYFIDDAGTIQLATEYSGYEAVNLFELEGDAYSDTIQQEILQWKENSSPLSTWSIDQMGQKRDYIVARYLPELHWHLVVERDTYLLMEQLTRQFTLTIVVIVTILALILFIITTVIRRFNKQITALIQTVETERQTLFEKATEQLFEDIYEIDITHDLPANNATAAYFESLGAPAGCPYSQALRIVAEKQIKAPFRQGYLDTFLPEHVQRAYETGIDSLLYEFMLSEDGTQYYWMRITAQIVKWGSDGSLHLLVYRQNIDEEKHRERKMRELAQTDEMTGLLTKTATQQHIEALLAEHPGESFAYFIFDIDNFKQVNDRFGHAFGDTVITAFAQTLRENFRAEDILGRIGGDEFTAFVPSPSSTWAEEKAQSLCQALCSVQTHSGKEWHVSTSIGIALSPQHGTDFTTLYEHADIALYQIKKRGKNGVAVFDGN